jgi:hypothetical protein
MTLPKPTTDESTKPTWTYPKEGKWTHEDVGQQHLESLLEVRAGATLQLARIAASGALDCTSALAVVEDAIGRVARVYDDYQTQVYVGEQGTLTLPLNMADQYFELINQP